MIPYLQQKELFSQTQTITIITNTITIAIYMIVQCHPHDLKLGQNGMGLMSVARVPPTFIRLLFTITLSCTSLKKNGFFGILDLKGSNMPSPSLARQIY